MFADKLRALRRELKLKQEDLAEKLGVHVNTISRWERSDGSPKMSDIQYIASNLGVPVSYFVEESDSQQGKVREFEIGPYARIRDRARRDGCRMTTDERDEVLVLLTQAMEVLLGGDIKIMDPHTRDEIETMRTKLYTRRKDLPLPENKDEAFVFEIVPFAEAYDLARLDVKCATAKQREMAVSMLRHAVFEMSVDLPKETPPGNEH